MDVVVVAVIGALVGAYSAKKRGGNGKDVAQYAAVFAIVFALVGLILSVIYSRMVAG